MSTCIVVDSGADLIGEYPNVIVVPLRFIFGDESFTEDEMTQELFKEKSEKEWPKTSGPNVDDYRKVFMKAIEDGYDHILCLPISPGMSISYNSAVLAKRYMDKDPDFSEKSIIEVVDTHTISMGVGFLVDALSEKLKDPKVTFDNLVEISRVFYKNTKLMVAIDNIENLVRGGRAKNAQRIVSDIFDIKAILDIHDEFENDEWVGKIVNIARRRTMRKSLIFIINEIKKITNIKRIDIAHTGNIEEALDFRSKVVKELNALGHSFKEEYVPMVQICLAIEVHTGPGALGICALS
jgi:DegV family protein with EDD domain